MQGLIIRKNFSVWDGASVEECNPVEFIVLIPLDVFQENLLKLLNLVHLIYLVSHIKAIGSQVNYKTHL